MSENKKDILNSINKCLLGISGIDTKLDDSTENEINEIRGEQSVESIYTAKVANDGICEIGKCDISHDNDTYETEVEDDSDKFTKVFIDFLKSSTIDETDEHKKSNNNPNSEVYNLIKPVMEANNLNGTLSTIQFLVGHYNRTKHYKGPGLMTIDDADKYIYIKEYPYNPRGYDKDMTRVLITYAKDFSDDEFSVDSVEFNCSSMEDLRMKWHDFIVQNGIYPDSIQSFSIDVSFNYRQYLDSMISSIYNTPCSVFIDDKLFDTVINTAIYEDEVEYVKDILLTSKLFAPFRGSIVFPHIEKVKNPNSGKMVPCVLRYIVEKGDDEE